MERIRHPQKLGDRLAEPDQHDVSFVALFDGWVSDLERFHGSAVAHLACNWELVVVDNPIDDVASERIAVRDRVLHVPLRDRVGYGAGRNLGLRLATGRIVVIVDTSVELTGDVFTSVDKQLSDDAVGIVGRWGVVTTHGFHFDESEGPDVAAVEGYFMAMRRADLARTGLFDPKFKFYRNADLDFSFQVRATGLRAITDPTLDVVRHTHRLWESTRDRDDLSRKNFFRFRDHWAEREDLLASRED